ncbi:MAG: hypothetical protein WBS54_05765 [Acidobacteriota bacterium]
MITLAALAVICLLLCGLGVGWLLMVLLGRHVARSAGDQRWAWVASGFIAPYIPTLFMLDSIKGHFFLLILYAAGFICAVTALVLEIVHLPHPRSTDADAAPRRMRWRGIVALAVAQVGALPLIVWGALQTTTVRALVGVLGGVVVSAAGLAVAMVTRRRAGENGAR